MRSRSSRKQLSVDLREHALNRKGELFPADGLMVQKSQVNGQPGAQFFPNICDSLSGILCDASTGVLHITTDLVTGMTGHVRPHKLVMTAALIGRIA
jgi:hypothetical protein